jgi:hypothetical protein
MTPPAPRCLALLLLALLTPALSARVSACDSTGCLLATRGSSSLVPQGRFVVDVSFRSALQTHRQEGSRTTERVERPKVDFENAILRPAFHEDLGGRERFLQIDVGYGVGPRTAVMLSFPVFAQRLYDVSHGPVTTAYDSRGVGDAVLGVRQSILARTRTQLVGALSLKLPSGSSKLTDSFDGTQLEPMLQPGTGSRDVVGSVQLGVDVIPGRLSGTVLGSYQANSTNSSGYRFGNEKIATLGLSAPLPGRLNASMQVKRFEKGRSRFHDVDVPSTGVRIVYVTPGLRWAATSSVSSYAFFQAPVSRFVNEKQLAPRRGFLLGVSKSF